MTADSLIEEEVQFLRVAMGHESESLDDFVKARDACQEDLMYFPGRSSYGLASVAGNSEKLAALQNDFEIMKKRMEDEAKKATRLEEKIKLLTHGHQTRAGKLWSQIEATFKQMDTAATELECFQALQKQEVVAASYRINSLVEEVNRQKELERKLQHRYGGLIAEHDILQGILEEHKERLRIQEETAAKNRAIEEETAAQNQALETAAQNQALMEETAAKNQALEEGAVPKNYNVDEEMVDATKVVDACRSNSGLNQSDSVISDPTETSTFELTAEDGGPGGKLIVNSDPQVDILPQDADGGLIANVSSNSHEMVTIDSKSQNTDISVIKPDNQSLVESSFTSDPGCQALGNCMMSEVYSQIDRGSINCTVIVQEDPAVNSTDETNVLAVGTGDPTKPETSEEINKTGSAVVEGSEVTPPVDTSIQID